VIYTSLPNSDPSTKSSEYQSMSADWTLVSDILAGPEAVRNRRETYLPKYQDEGEDEYDRRARAAPWRPEFADALRTLASKPFAKDVAIKGDAPDDLIGALDASTKQRSGGIIDDVDGRGNSLTSFARESFTKGIAKGLHVILVDYPDINPDGDRRITLADEKAAHARPYWVQVQADDIIALYTETVGGKERITHARIKESVVVRNGFGERKVDRIRVLESGRWELWERLERSSTPVSTNADWLMVAEGLIRRGPSEASSVPLVLFFTGERRGDVLVRPPLADLAHMQIELLRAMSRQDEILTFAGAPMLAGIGMAKPAKGESMEVGPKRVLWAPPGSEHPTDWKYVQPNPENIKEIREHVASIIADMRRLGMQPLMQASGSPTATGQSIEAAKAHSAVKAWALMLNDAIEQAMVFTAEWMGIQDTIQTTVSTDFSAMLYAIAPLNALKDARAMKDISQKTYWEGLKRFDVLPQDFDLDAEQKAIAVELKNLAVEVPVDPLGEPLVIPRGATLL